MKQPEVFDVVFLIGRPAAGKSEIIDFLSRTPEEERRERFHVGRFTEIDDFPMLWAWFEEDSILESMGKPRLHTDADGYFLYQYLWNVLIRRLELELSKLERAGCKLGKSDTAIIEFSRGTGHGGYAEAFSHFSSALLGRGAVLYIDVSFEESRRKNRLRYDPDAPHGILTHSLPDDKLERLYGEVDWDAFRAPDTDRIVLGGVNVPYAVFENEDDVTTGTTGLLPDRLYGALNTLWERYSRGIVHQEYLRRCRAEQHSAGVRRSGA